MAIVAKFRVDQVSEIGGRVLVPADPDDEGAMPVAEAPYRVVGWEPLDVTHVRWSSKVSEQVKLSAVMGDGDPNDPNLGWAAATPAGSLEITIDNPGAWGYFRAGEEYKLEVTRHQPQKSRAPKT